MPDRANTKHDSVNARESELLRRIAGEDRTALSALYRTYQPRLFNFVYRLTNSFGIADELANDVMLIVWRKASSFRGASKVSTWIFGIAYRQTMRRVAKKELPISWSTDLESLASGGEGQVEREDWVRRGMLELPAAQQLTVLLVFYVGMSYEEVAEATDCPVNTVKTRMFHARKKLKDLLTAAAAPESTSVGE